MNDDLWVARDVRRGCSEYLYQVEPGESERGGHFFNPPGTDKSCMRLEQHYGLAPGEKAKARLVVGTCEWRHEEEGVYSTLCGEAFTFIDGGPVENGMNYCHHCGRPVVLEEEPK